MLIYGRERGVQRNVVVMPKSACDPLVIWNERLARRNRLRLRQDGGRGCDGRLSNKLWDKDRLTHSRCWKSRGRGCDGRLPNKLWDKDRLTHSRCWKSRGRGRRGEINNRVGQIGR